VRERQKKQDEGSSPVHDAWQSAALQLHDSIGFNGMSDFPEDKSQIAHYVE